jgi:hypothetical protein
MTYNLYDILDISYNSDKSILLQYKCLNSLKNKAKQILINDNFRKLYDNLSENNKLKFFN